MIQYLADIDHYNVVLDKVRNAKSLLWIGTADIKDLHVKSGGSSEPFLGLVSNLIKHGVSTRLIHAK